MQNTGQDMKTTLVFLAIFSLLLFSSSSIADGRKYPEKYSGKGRNLGVLVPMREAAAEKISSEMDNWTVATGAEAEAEAEECEVEEKEVLDTFSEPVGSGGGGDPKEEEPLGTSSELVLDRGGGGGDPKEEKSEKSVHGSGDSCVVMTETGKVFC